MKSILRRTAVLLLVLAMVLSMLPSVFAATGSKIYNNGTRDQACTALSSQAKAYYTGNYTYEKLSALSGATQTESSYDATQNNPLYDALYELMSTTQTDNNDKSNSYNSLSTDFAYTDSVAGASEGEMSDIWGGRLDKWNGSYFNREHVWPKSRASFYQINGGADRHHLRPASAYINKNVHYHHPYGNTTNGTAYKDELGNPGGWLDGTYYEPNDNVKGDVARILLYVYVRWQQPNLYSDVVSDNLPEFDKDDNEKNPGSFRSPNGRDVRNLHGRCNGTSRKATGGGWLQSNRRAGRFPAKKAIRPSRPIQIRILHRGLQLSILI